VVLIVCAQWIRGSYSQHLREHDSKLSFVNRDMGWILATSLYQTVILQTTDGGHTWVSLNEDIPQISSEQYFHFFDVVNGMIVAENANTAAINYEYYFTKPFRISTKLLRGLFSYQKMNGNM
jgi:DNA-binding transcriptional MocR family regulator